MNKYLLTYLLVHHYLSLFLSFSISLSLTFYYLNLFFLSLSCFTIASLMLNCILSLSCVLFVHILFILSLCLGKSWSFLCFKSFIHLHQLLNHFKLTFCFLFEICYLFVCFSTSVVSNDLFYPHFCSFSYNGVYYQNLSFLQMMS